MTTLRLSATSLSLKVGDQAKLSVETFDQYGNPISGAGAASWSTSDARVASVNGNGNVRAAGVGRATITARIAGKSASASVDVGAR